MRRTIINLDSDDKQWLDREAKARKVPMTELVRQAVYGYRIREESRGSTALQTALKNTAGIWREGDGLAYQRKLRKGWTEREWDICVTSWPISKSRK